MTAETLIKNGDVAGALAALQDDIRANPGDGKLRVFLFQVLCVMGDWSRAVAQLKTCVTLDPGTEPMARMYREAIVAEVAREKVFAGARPPVFGDEEASWLPVLWDALKKEMAGDTEGAEALRAMALKAAPAVPGRVNGADFEWIADADPRLGPVLEVITGGHYTWMPFSALSRITLEAPRDLRDLVWTPVTMTLRDGTDALGLIPTRYPGTGKVFSDAHRLARTTDWTDAGGTGQRMLCTDAGEFALLDLREITLENVPAAMVHHG